MLTQSNLNERMRMLHNRISDDIVEYGQFIMCVGASSKEEAQHRDNYFMYTIGNCEQNLPELIIVGFMTPALGPLINKLGADLRARGRVFDSGDVFVPEGFTASIKIIDCDVEQASEFIIQAYQHYPQHDLYRNPIYVQQIILSDKEGKFPGQDGCDPVVAAQPILGPTLSN